MGFESNAKRKAEEELPCPWLRQYRLDSPSCLSPTPQEVALPTSSSINNIIRQHPRVRLYVTPLHWQMRHLELLGCQFVPEKARRRQNGVKSAPERRCRYSNAKETRSCSEIVSPRHQQQSDAATSSTEPAIRAADHLLHSHWNKFKTLAVHDLLNDYEIRRIG